VDIHLLMFVLVGGKVVKRLGRWVNKRMDNLVSTAYIWKIRLFGECLHETEFVILKMKLSYNHKLLKIFL
jgi:hypothetical protein